MAAEYPEDVAVLLLAYVCPAIAALAAEEATAREVPGAAEALTIAEVAVPAEAATPAPAEVLGVRRGPSMRVVPATEDAVEDLSVGVEVVEVEAVWVMHMIWMKNLSSILRKETLTMVQVLWK